jgi:hypothetical protein
MFYIGFPIRKATAFKIFNQPETCDIEAYISSKRLRLYEIDKGLCVLGLAVKSLSNYLSVDDTIITILNYKKKVSRRLVAANADLSDFDLEVMESEPIHVKNPSPMAMTFDDYGAYFSDSDDTTPPPSPSSRVDWLEELRRADTPPA